MRDFSANAITKMTETGRLADQIGIVHAICEGTGQDSDWTSCRYPDCACDGTSARAAQAIMDHGLVVIHGTLVGRLREALEGGKLLFESMAEQYSIPENEWKTDWEVLEEHAR